MGGIRRWLQSGGRVWVVVASFLAGVASAEVSLQFAEPLPAAVVCGVTPVHLVGSLPPQGGMVLLYLNQRCVFSTNILPCRYDWDTTRLPDGAYTLRAEIYHQGKMVSASEVAVEVRNGRRVEEAPFVEERTRDAWREGLGASSPSAKTEPTASEVGWLTPGSQHVLPPSPAPAIGRSISPLPRLRVVGSALKALLHWQSQPVATPLSWEPRSGRLYVPVREVMSLLGGEVGWRHETKEVEILYQGERVEIRVGQGTARRGEETVPLPGPLRLKAQRTWFPLRAVEVLFGVRVDWSPEAP